MDPTETKAAPRAMNAQERTPAIEHPRMTQSGNTLPHGPFDARLTAIQHSYLVATADEFSDESARALSGLLSDMRLLLNMDIVFVAEFSDGRRIFRHVATSAASSQVLFVGQSHALEDTYCQRIVDGRLPRVIRNAAALHESAALAATIELRIGAYLSARVVLPSGQLFGTLCCISHTTRTSLGPLEADALQSVSRLVSGELERRRTGH